MNDYKELIDNTNRLFGEGKASEGLEAYGLAVLHSGDCSWLEALEEWLLQDKVFHQAGEETFCRLMMRVMNLVDELPEERQDRVRERCLQILGSFPETAPRQDVTDRYVVECIFYRHMGRYEEGLKAALTGLEKHGTASCATFAGLCCLALEDAEQAGLYVKKGLELDPHNGSGCNDVADYFFNRRRWDKAEEYYRLALSAKDPYDREWAEPSWIFCRYMLTEDTYELEHLAACAAAYPENDRARRLCGAAREEQRIPYVDFLPGSTEATIHFLRDLRERGSDITQGRMALTCQEAASSINAIRLHLSRYGKRDNRFDIIVSHIPDPPLNRTEVPEGAVYWHYREDNDAEPVMERPSTRIAEIVKELAGTPFSLPEWYEKGKAAAMKVGAEAQKDLYACMVYPPSPENGEAAEEWLMQVQYAAVCILAGLGGRHIKAESDLMQRCKEWLPSPELARICLGQLDWPVIPALTLLAWQMKEGIADQELSFCILSSLLHRVSAHDYCFYEHALVCALTWIPGQTEGFYNNMRRRRRRLEEY